MYILHRHFYYKLALCLLNILCVESLVFLFTLVPSISREENLYETVIYFGLIIGSQLYCLIQLFNPKQNYVVLRIDKEGILLSEKKDDSVFVPWESIRCVTFVEEYYGSKIAILEYSKKTHYLRLTTYFHNHKPRKAIKAAYNCADNKKKIREIRDSLLFTYELWGIPKQ